ncbi:TerD-family protein [Wenjunlia vitaminophila]|uniref:TerD-family protein n=1 Tax=Wenjunlia vitaminophila TaxID=76728 RepID=A0A0T6LSH9_WENVI|nr:TerD family protein [Wenjunlia vitaminophila]KRV49053.1 TerD-family protein [Wenjunlia vitaminophila]
MGGLNKGLGKIKVTLKWDPSALGEPDTDLDLVAGTYRAEAPFGAPAYLVHFDSRSPDGTIILNRESHTGQGLGADEDMTLELDRLADEYVRVVVGVAIQQHAGRKTFGDIVNCGARVLDGYTELASVDFGGVRDCTAATVAEFSRTASGIWTFHALVRGFTTDPSTFSLTMGQHSA